MGKIWYIIFAKLIVQKEKKAKLATNSKEKLKNKEKEEQKRSKPIKSRIKLVTNLRVTRCVQPNQNNNMVNHVSEQHKALNKKQ